MTAPPLAHDGFVRSATLAEWAVGSKGWTAWNAARQRNDRRAQPLPVPPLTKVRMPGARQAVDSVPCAEAAAYVRFVVPDALAFFANAERVAALTEITGSPETAHAVRDQLLGAEAERMAELQTTLAALPALPSSTGPAIDLPTKKHETGQILVGVFRCLEWLGDADAGHTWNNWLRAALTEAMDESSRSQLDPVVDVKAPLLVHERIAGSGRHETPLVNFEALCIMMRLLANHTPACKTATQEAFKYLMRVKVGDASLIPELQRNVATATAETRQFVLGEDEARQQEWTNELRALEHQRRLREERLRLEGMEQYYHDLGEERKRLRDENWKVGEEERAAKRTAIRLTVDRTEAERKKFENGLRHSVEAGELTEAQVKEILSGPRVRIFKSLGEIIGLLDPSFRELTRGRFPFARRAMAELRAGFFAPKPLTDVCPQAHHDEILWYEDDLPALWRFCAAQMEQRREETRAPGQTTLFGTAPAVPEAPSEEELRRRVLAAV